MVVRTKLVVVVVLILDGVLLHDTAKIRQRPCAIFTNDVRLFFLEHRHKACKMCPVAKYD